MSLINKMLQDLDARGSGEPAAVPQMEVRSVPFEERLGSLRTWVIGASVLVIVAAASVLGWYYLKRPAPPAPVPATPVLQPRAVKMVAPPPELPAATVQAQAQAPARAALPPAPVIEKKASPPQPGSAAQSELPKRAAQAASARPAPKTSAPAAKTAPAPVPEGREMSAQQRAESEYRRALAALKEARNGEAIGALQQALQADPRHDAARQTLIGLLIESRRHDEAMRQLQLSLTLEPRQPSMAMLLARLQIERGSSGIDTLMRTLPYAAGNAQYHAFLAGALQREQRQREAIEQYQAALRSDPGNGVSLLGLGISLQLEKRYAEALAAFQQAKESGTLSPELKTFVERKLQQLAH